MGETVHRSRGQSRRSFLWKLGSAGALAVGTLSLGDLARAGSGPIPTTPTFYRVVLEGLTPFGQFAREGLLLVEPPLATGQINFDNGVNARDVGLLSGNPPGSPERGAIWFATNTSVYDRMGLDTNIDASLIDVAYVTADEQAGVLTVAVDGQVWGLPAARASVLNTFTPEGGLLANIYQIIQGGMQLQFRDGGSTVEGAMDFVGNGYIEPGSSRYTAALVGTVASG